MSTLKIMLGKLGDSGKHPIYIRLSHKRDKRKIHTGIKCFPNEWDGKELIKPYVGYVKANNIIQEKYTAYGKILLDNHDILDSLTIDQVKSMLVGSKEGLYPFWQKHIDDLYKQGRDGTASPHVSCMIALKKFTPRDLKPADITPKFLNEFESDWLKPIEVKGKTITRKLNGLSVYLRALKRILNLCIKEKLLPADRYPFKDYKIKSERTSKRAVKKDVITLIKNLELTGVTADHRNYFMFMFYMMGMNLIDLAYLKKENMQDGRIRYKRKKTGGEFNIKIVPEAQKIIDLYIVEDSEYLFPIIRDLKDAGTFTYKRYQARLKDHNKHLKKIGKILNLDNKVTSYVVRHSYATIGKLAGESTTRLQSALGHKTEKQTQTYLGEFENDVMDQMNERITG